MYYILIGTMRSSNEETEKCKGVKINYDRNLVKIFQFDNRFYINAYEQTKIPKDVVPTVSGMRLGDDASGKKDRVFYVAQLKKDQPKLHNEIESYGDERNAENPSSGKGIRPTSVSGRFGMKG